MSEKTCAHDSYDPHLPIWRGSALGGSFLIAWCVCLAVIVSAAGCASLSRLKALPVGLSDAVPVGFPSTVRFIGRTARAFREKDRKSVV